MTEALSFNLTPDRAHSRSSWFGQHQDYNPPVFILFFFFSQLLALSGSRVGQAHLAQQVDMLWDLLTLLHIASDRVQRQVSEQSCTVTA